LTPKTLDHVALWVADRDRIAGFLTTRLGMHVIDRTDAFTLVGADARRFKLTLFAADGSRERGALRHVALRVGDLEQALRPLSDLDVERPTAGEAYFDVYEGLRVGLVEAETDLDYDLDHVALFSADPVATAREYPRLGFAPAGETRVEVGGAFVDFHPGRPGAPERPLLNHLALLVDSADQHRAEAEGLGIEIADFVDAPNTLAVFVWGPERVKIEYVEHKPTFSLV
jgi:catechol 2,3-dioxygenase-like lactoylglutathione lyase family enzyme